MPPLPNATASPEGAPLPARPPLRERSRYRAGLPTGPELVGGCRAEALRPRSLSTHHIGSLLRVPPRSTLPVLNSRSSPKPAGPRRRIDDPGSACSEAGSRFRPDDAQKNSPQLPTLPTPPTSPIAIDAEIRAGRAVSWPPPPVRFSADQAGYQDAASPASLPPHLVDRIVQHLERAHTDAAGPDWCLSCFRADLFQLALVSTNWHRAANRALYHRLCVVLEIADFSFLSRPFLRQSGLEKYHKLAARNHARLIALLETLEQDNFRLGLQVERIEAAHVQIAIEQELTVLQLEADKGRPRPAQSGLADRMATLISACPNVQTVGGLYYWAPTSELRLDLLASALTSRQHLREKIWILTDADVGLDPELEQGGEDDSDVGRVGRRQGTLRPQLLSPETERFADMHLNWSSLETLVLYGTLSNSSQLRITYRTFVELFKHLPKLQNLWIGGLPPSAFSDNTLTAIPAVKCLRLENLSGVTDTGLSRMDRYCNSSKHFQSLSLINLGIGIQTVQRMLMLPQLKRFTLIQDDLPLPHPKNASAPFHFQSPKLQFLHWDILSTTPATEALARCISDGVSFPELTQIRAPTDHSGLLQNLCRPRTSYRSFPFGSRSSTDSCSKKEPSPESHRDFSIHDTFKKGASHKYGRPHANSLIPTKRGMNELQTSETVEHVYKLLEPFQAHSSPEEAGDGIKLMRTKAGSERDSLLDTNTASLLLPFSSIQSVYTCQSAQPTIPTLASATYINGRIRQFKSKSRSLASARFNADMRIQLKKRPPTVTLEPKQLDDLFRIIIRIAQLDNSATTTSHTSSAKPEQPTVSADSPNVQYSHTFIKLQETTPGAPLPTLATKLPAIVISTHAAIQSPRIRQIHIFPDFIGSVPSKIDYILQSSIHPEAEMATPSIRDIFEPKRIPAVFDILMPKLSTISKESSKRPASIKRPKSAISTIRPSGSLSKQSLSRRLSLRPISKTFASNFSRLSFETPVQPGTEEVNIKKKTSSKRRSSVFRKSKSQQVKMATESAPTLEESLTSRRTTANQALTETTPAEEENESSSEYSTKMRLMDEVHANLSTDPTLYRYRPWSGICRSDGLAYSVPDSILCCPDRSSSRASLLLKGRVSAIFPTSPASPASPTSPPDPRPVAASLAARTRFADHLASFSFSFSGYSNPNYICPGPAGAGPAETSSMSSKCGSKWGSASTVKRAAGHARSLSDSLAGRRLSWYQRQLQPEPAANAKQQQKKNNKKKQQPNGASGQKRLSSRASLIFSKPSAAASPSEPAPAPIPPPAPAPVSVELAPASALTPITATVAASTADKQAEKQLRRASSPPGPLSSTAPSASGDRPPCKCSRHPESYRVRKPIILGRWF